MLSPIVFLASINTIDRIDSSDVFIYFSLGKMFPLSRQIERAKRGERKCMVKNGHDPFSTESKAQDAYDMFTWNLKKLPQNKSEGTNMSTRTSAFAARYQKVWPRRELMLKIILLWRRGRSSNSEIFYNWIYLHEKHAIIEGKEAGLKKTGSNARRTMMVLTLLLLKLCGYR